MGIYWFKFHLEVDLWLYRKSILHVKIPQVSFKCLTFIRIIDLVGVIQSQKTENLVMYNSYMTKENNYLHYI